MLGTLNGALEAREIQLSPDSIMADVQGINEIVERVPVLTEIRVHYRLKIPPGTRETIDRVLERHASRCPTAMSLSGAVEVTWTADIEEE